MVEGVSQPTRPGKIRARLDYERECCCARFGGAPLEASARAIERPALETYWRSGRLGAVYRLILLFPLLQPSRELISNSKRFSEGSAVAQVMGGLAEIAPDAKIQIGGTV